MEMVHQQIVESTVFEITASVGISAPLSVHAEIIADVLIRAGFFPEQMRPFIEPEIRHHLADQLEPGAIWDGYRVFSPEQTAPLLLAWRSEHTGGRCLQDLLEAGPRRPPTNKPALPEPKPARLPAPMGARALLAKQDRVEAIEVVLRKHPEHFALISGFNEYDRPLASELSINRIAEILRHLEPAEFANISANTLRAAVREVFEGPEKHAVKGPRGSRT
jgi:hypothetical protein